jgi:septum formation protein
MANARLTPKTIAGVFFESSYGKSSATTCIAFRPSFANLRVVLILASASPRRHELLVAAGIDHIVRPSCVPEDRHPEESPGVFVQRVAEEKARATLCAREDVVLAADTIVCADDFVLGKPSGNEDAIRMLRLLSGRAHWVHTGICILSGAQCVLDVASTRVSFISLTEDEIQDYVQTGEPRDKAGAYAIQGYASKFVWSIAGCYHNVVGLPVSLVYRHLKTLGSANMRS